MVFLVKTRGRFKQELSIFIIVGVFLLFMGKFFFERFRVGRLVVDAPFENGVHNSLIFARSLLTTALPVKVTYLLLPVSEKARVAVGESEICLTVSLLASVKK